MSLAPDNLALNPDSGKPEIDTTLKEAYKKFVDVCLTDFCYPRFAARL
ncbi:hypothetical protein ACFSOZ_37015 [Mesorhizobium newzealandense]|uniref:Uncharacterized protein n=1 Tax=Mesorhizobium newzealandense TaxID=1300302 RepID=A0ABW4UM44_9HYPH